MNRNAQWICYFTLISCISVFAETIISDTPLRIHNRETAEEPSPDIKVIGLPSSTNSPSPTTISSQSSSALPSTAQVTPTPLLLPASIAHNVNRVTSLLESIQKQQLAQISDQVNFNSENDKGEAVTTTAVPTTTSLPATSEQPRTSAQPSTTATTVKTDQRSRRSSEDESYSGMSIDSDSGNTGEVVEESATDGYQYSEYFEPPSAASYSEYK